MREVSAGKISPKTHFGAALRFSNALHARLFLAPPWEEPASDGDIYDEYRTGWIGWKVVVVV